MRRFLSSGRRRYALLLLLVGAGSLALMGNSCAPAPTKPPAPGPQPGENIATYFVIDGVPDGTNMTRSTSPLSLPYSGGNGTASQTLNSDGSVALDVNGTQATVVGTSGFTIKFGPLSDLSTVVAQTAQGSNQIALSVSFDMNGDGNFGGLFNADGTQISFDPDVLALTGSGVTTINDSTPLTLQFGNAAGTFTLAQLKSGDSGIDPNTPVAVGISLIGPAGSHRNATVNSVAINDTEKL
jgi:hypothetical protein